MGNFLTNDLLVRGSIILYILGVMGYKATLWENAGSYTLFGLELFYLALIVFVFIVRIPAVNKAKGLTERLVPFIAITFITMHAFIPETRSELYNSAAVLIGVGLVIQIVSIFSLRRSFSFFVETREFTATGIYNFLRHPDYLGTIIAATGLFVLRISWFAALFLILIIIWQIYRALLEEKKMESAFPQYKEYKSNVSFMIPFTKMKKVSSVIPPIPQSNETNMNNQNEENISS